MDCSICLDCVDIDVYKCNECKNYFHLHCILEWYTNKEICPLCRQDIELNEREQRVLNRIMVRKEIEKQNSYEDVYIFTLYENNYQKIVKTVIFKKKERSKTVNFFIFNRVMTVKYPFKMFFEELDGMIENFKTFPLNYTLEIQ